LTFPDPDARHKPWSRFTAPKFVDDAYGFMEFFSKMAFLDLNASQGPFAPSSGGGWRCEIAKTFSGKSGIVVQDGLGCGARERGDEWRNVH
jgi:hypothetical protein